MISLKTVKTLKLPDLSGIQDAGAKQVLNDTHKAIKTMSQSLYDDLTALNALIDKKADA